MVHEIRNILYKKESEKYDKLIENNGYTAIWAEYADLFWWKLSLIECNPNCKATREIMDDHGFKWDKDRRLFANNEGDLLKW